ncbi:2-keto-4-pentenoate hydratase [Oxalicibacterium faecigallinarum]|uniref:2-keto-4-pentenoate hydratase n=1 Tax=Oxalicibacterium faecigallinarum TaxID=573741 RepID=A0A8J3AUJ1_9BURK|nr:fumarylacetoacetate hydrolase family protein [Oxalicibacterium faecigallinarum]GGI21173.1 2-keto-4-pentenoate hydratase [Oxalicibacterium faecigallinarum]
MLMSTQANRYAHQLLEARAKSQEIPCISRDTELSIADAYDIAKCIMDIRIAQGETPIGRKIGFTNRRIWANYGEREPISAPMWSYMYDDTVRFAEDNSGVQSLAGAVQPRIEPEIVFKLGTAPSPDATLEEIADCIEWMAHGFELVACPFPDWKFDAADAIAAFGLHGTLIIGEPHVLSSATRRHLADILTAASVSLSYSEGAEFTLQSAGFGSNVLDSPVHAVWQLHQTLKTQPQFAPLQAGELIATGTLTDAHPIKAGQTWSTAFSGVTLPGMTLSLI